MNESHFRLPLLPTYSTFYFAIIPAHCCCIGGLWTVLHVSRVALLPSSLLIIISQLHTGAVGVNTEQQQALTQYISQAPQCSPCVQPHLENLSLEKNSKTLLWFKLGVAKCISHMNHQQNRIVGPRASENGSIFYGLRFSDQCRLELQRYFFSISI